MKKISDIKKIRIVIIEDNRLLREGITALMKEQTDINVAASFGTGENLSVIMKKFNPDVILLDIGLRNQNSLNLVKTIKKDFPDAKTIVMDLIPLHTDILEFVQAGVSGFILKDARIKDFIGTIRSVYNGEKILPGDLTGSLFSQIVDHTVGMAKSSQLVKSVQMTKRERQVIKLIADGLTNKEIGYRLHLSIYTVKSHVHNILEKLTLRTRVQIAKYSHDLKDIADSISLIEE